MKTGKTQLEILFFLLFRFSYIHFVSNRNLFFGLGLVNYLKDDRKEFRKKFRIIFIKSLILAQDERWRRG